MSKSGGDIESQVAEGTALEDCSRPSMSYIRSLPVANADSTLFEGDESAVAVAIATEVVPIPDDDDYDDGDAIASSKDRNERPFLISVLFNKRLKTAIGFRNYNGNLHISSLDDAIAPSSILPGDRVISVDQTHVGNWQKNQIENYIRDQSGIISICVVNPKAKDEGSSEVVVWKRDFDKIGVTFRNDDDGFLRIKRILNSYMMQDIPLLTAGDFVTSINRIPCRQTPSSTAISMVKGDPNIVIITAKNNGGESDVLSGEIIRLSTRRLEDFLMAPHHSAREVLEDNNLLQAARKDNRYGIFPVLDAVNPYLVSVQVTKPTRDTALGLNISEIDKKLIISHLPSYGLFQSSTLRPGYQLLSVNGHSTVKLTKTEVDDLLRSLVGNVTLIALNPNYDKEIKYIATASKSSPRETVGVGIRASVNGQLKLGSINASKCFGSSILTEGDRIISINDINCESMSISEAVEIIKRAVDVVNIVCKPTGKGGIVLAILDGTRTQQANGAGTRVTQQANGDVTGVTQQANGDVTRVTQHANGAVTRVTQHANGAETRVTQPGNGAVIQPPNNCGYWGVIALVILLLVLLAAMKSGDEDCFYYYDAGVRKRYCPDD